MRIEVRGGSIIKKELDNLGVETSWLPRDDIDWYSFEYELGDRLLIVQGVNYQHHISTANRKKMKKEFAVNCTDVIRIVERFLRRKGNGRVVVIGSDSAFKGSYNASYAASKAGLHAYVENKRVGKGQQLVCIAPSMIKDSWMVKGRNEEGRLALEDRIQKHPQRRMVTGREVASLVHWLLGPDGQFVSGVVIRMNGGEHCRSEW